VVVVRSGECLRDQGIADRIPPTEQLPPRVAPRPLPDVPTRRDGVLTSGSGEWG
jgi:hypothetical protein